MSKTVASYKIFDMYI